MESKYYILLMFFLNDNVRLSDIPSIHYSRSAIQKYRKIIKGELAEMNRGSISFDIRYYDSRILSRTFCLYDHHFFFDMLTRTLNERISFRFSNRMTRTGGKVEYAKGEQTYVMKLSYPLIAHSFEKTGASYEVNGILCTDSIDALMCIMEHEMIHVIEFELYGKSFCSKHPFKTLARNIFGHTDTKHRLGMKSEKKAGVMSIPIGSKVSFEHRGKIYTGTLSRITKRATVIPDASSGCMYGKFYVPIDKLILVDGE